MCTCLRIFPVIDSCWAQNLTLEKDIIDQDLASLVQTINGRLWVSQKPLWIAGEGHKRSKSLRTLSNADSRLIKWVKF